MTTGDRIDPKSMVYADESDHPMSDALDEDKQEQQP